MAGPPAVILVVDDNEMNRDMLSRRLEKKDYTVITAEGGRRALDLVLTQSVDLVLLDVMMPDMSGVEVLRELRKTRSAEELPVIMATARSDSADVVEALELGANDYVTKPIDFPVLLARVHSHLRTRRKAVATGGGGGIFTPSSQIACIADLPAGTVLGGSYEIEDKIGTGGFGTVYRAKHLRLPQHVAIKVLHGNMAQQPRMLARFEREATATCRVKHPNAVTVFDYGVTPEGTAYLVMELLEGVPLSDVIRRDTQLPPQRAAEILKPVCEVLEEVHQAGVLHRDLKPANIFLERRSGREVVKVVDFGIAKIMTDEHQIEAEPLTIEGTMVGTPSYMAPERILNKPCDGRSDVYAVGVMLYELIAGKRPFVSDLGAVGVVMMHINDPVPSLRAAVPSVPEALDALVAQTMAKDPDHRPTAGALGRELAPFAQASPTA